MAFIYFQFLLFLLLLTTITIKRESCVSAFVVVKQLSSLMFVNVVVMCVVSTILSKYPICVRDFVGIK